MIYTAKFALLMIALLFTLASGMVIQEHPDPDREQAVKGITLIILSMVIGIIATFL